MVAKALLANELNVYLPQKEVVILEWWFYFVGEKKNTTARCDADYWTLFSQVWSSLQNDQETLSRIYLSNSFLALLSNFLSDFVSTKQDNEAIIDTVSAVGAAIKLVGTSGLWFRMASDLAHNIIHGFLNFIVFLKAHHTEALADQSVLNLTQEIVSILHATLHGTADLKGLSSIFSTKSLPLAFLTLGHDLPEDVLTAVKSFTSVLLHEKDSLAESNFDAISPDIPFLKSIDHNIMTHSSLIFYSIICEKAPTKAPDAFFKLTQFYPDSTKQLIKVSRDFQIKLSVDSLIALVEKTVESETLDWDFLESTLDLDSTVITEDKMVSKLLSTKSTANPAFDSFSQAFIKYFAEARELTSFIISWKQHIKETSQWCSDSVLHCIAFHVKSLSSHQLKGLFGQLIKPLQNSKSKESASQSYLPIIAVVMSFFLQSSAPPAILHESLFAIIDSDHLVDSQLFWRTKYLILSLSGSIVHKASKSLLKQAKNIKYGLEEKNIDDLALHVMQTVFRIREFAEIEKFDSIVKKVLKFIQKKATDPERILEVINQRWLLIAENTFDKENQERLIDSFASHEVAFSKLCQNDIFYEQRSLSKIVVTQIAGDSADIGISKIKLLSTMPMEIVWRENRAKLLTSLANLPFDSSDIEHQLYIRTTINKFVRQTTVSTDFESKPSVLREYFTALGTVQNDKLELVTREACESVLEYHSKSMTSQTISENYIQELISQEKSFLKKVKKSKSLDWAQLKHLDFTCLVAAKSPLALVTDSGLGQLLNEILLAQLESPSSEHAENQNKELMILRNLDMISAFSKTLMDTSLLHPLLGKFSIQSIQNLENSTQNSHSRNVLVHSFQVLVRTSTELSQLENVVALYTFISQLGVEVDNSDLVSALSRLDDADYTALLSALVQDSFSGTLSPTAYYRVASTFASASDHKSHPSSIEHFIKLIGLTLVHGKVLDAEAVIAFLDLIDLLLRDKSWVITQYGLELVIAATTAISLEGPALEKGQNQDFVFVRVTHVLSSILLFHRHRLNGRYFLFTKLLTCLLAALAAPRHNLVSTRFSHVPASQTVACEHQLTEKSALAFSRLVENLCDPSTQAVRERGGKANLSSASGIAKRQVSKFIGILLINYIRLTLQTGFSGPIKKALTPGFYLVFDVLGEDRMKNTNFLLDANSRPFFKTLYEDYMAHGKWKND